MDPMARLELTKATDEAIKNAQSLVDGANNFTGLGADTISNIAQAAALVAIAKALRELARRERIYSGCQF